MLLGEESRCSWKSWVFMTFLKEEGPPCFNSEQNQAKYFPGRLDNFHIPLWVKAGALYASPVLCLGTLCSSIQCYYVKGQNLMWTVKQVKGDLFLACISSLITESRFDFKMFEWMLCILFWWFMSVFNRAKADICVQAKEILLTQLWDITFQMHLIAVTLIYNV